MAKGATYKSDYYAILSWVVEAVAGKPNIIGGNHEEAQSSFPVDLVETEQKGERLD